MNDLRKICVITGTRADYGLLMPLLEEINNDELLDLQLIVTGMHLSPEFGLTYKEIEKNFKINKKIEILLSSDSSIGISKSMGLANISFAEAYEDLKPDLIVVLGDRFEIFSAVSTAMISRIPIAHLSGGELTEGAIDDCIRHAITKMSHLHFVATQEYKNRVIQLGENPKNVYNFGEAGLDNIKNLDLLSKNDFEKSIDFILDKKSLLITYHPTTLDEIDIIEKDFKIILEELDILDNTSLIFTKANSDEGGRLINKMIDDYVKLNNNKAICFTSMGQIRYLSALQYVDAVFGNTSSGIVEAPSFKIASINIGDRQKGRVQSLSVLNCTNERESIKKAIIKLYSEEFIVSLKTTINPYKQENTSFKTKEILKNINLKNIIKKTFWDIK
ncbi:MAG: UDP-N-acetylglucosamine 2-epimerase [Campylobacterales bacterium]|nr:UDP-N-acetylglucosamine 2-epimerase [Campylobacterales bacterium]